MRSSIWDKYKIWDKAAFSFSFFYLMRQCSQINNITEYGMSFKPHKMNPVHFCSSLSVKITRPDWSAGVRWDEMRTRARWRRIVSFACICLHVVISQLCVKIQENKMTFLALSSRQMFKEAKVYFFKSTGYARWRRGVCFSTDWLHKQACLTCSVPAVFGLLVPLHEAVLSDHTSALLYPEVKGSLMDRWPRAVPTACFESGKCVSYWANRQLSKILVLALLDLVTPNINLLFVWFYFKI